MSSIDTYANRIENKKRSPLIIDLCRKNILKRLERLSVGRLLVIEGEQTFEFGQSQIDTDLTATIEIFDKAIYQRVAFGGTTGVAESYISGEWQTPNLTDVIRLFLLNASTLGNMESFISRLASRCLSSLERLTPYTLSSAKKNILAHYDLSNDFFSTFLDPTMMYSSAIYKSEDQPLQEASVNKLQTICEKLQLKPTDHLVEIGTGWGGMAIHAATHFNCRVTTTTISDQQYKYVVNKVKSLGLDDKITVLCKDYRILEGQYDKLVSIEMIEAIGYQEFKPFFRKCQSLLKRNGLALIQAISRPDQDYHQKKSHVDFIKRYIFPGGCLPSQAEMLRVTGQFTDLHLMDIEDMTLDYANTLRDWKSAFFHRIDDVKKLGFNQPFIRLWDFYLSYCEGGFKERAIFTSQLVFARPDYRR